MDKRVIFAVAGSGKTTRLVNELNETDRALIITYTGSNYEHLRRSIIAKFGYFPETIYLDTYFSFLYGFCIRPLIGAGTKGLFFENAPVYATGMTRYMTPSGYIYANRAAKLIEAAGLESELIGRLQKYFKAVYIDEIQDFGGHDFNLLTTLCKANIKILMVGDFYQHTYDTSRDGNVNAKLHDNIETYEKRFRQMGLGIDKETLKRSRRCSPQVCGFITDKLGIAIESSRFDKTDIELIDSIDKAKLIHRDNSVVKLFYQGHAGYGCYSRNWGECKGEDQFNDVCVVLNKTTMKAFKSNKLHTLSPLTKSKLYVACTRAKGTLYFVSDELIKQCMEKVAIPIE